jgi:hypothetical protein
MTTDSEAPRRGRPPKIIDDTETDTVAKGTYPGWKPSSLLGTLKARSGFTARWVSHDPARIAKMRSEGWITMKPTDNIGTYAQDESSLSGELRYRDMIGMMLPDQLKKSRNEYYRKETDDATRAILKQTDGEMRQKGVSTYTPKGMPGRIVID